MDRTPGASSGGLGRRTYLQSTGARASHGHRVAVQAADVGGFECHRVETGWPPDGSQRMGGHSYIAVLLALLLA